MWKNVTIGVLSVTLVIVFALYWASRKLAIEATNEIAAKNAGTATGTAASQAPTR
jgi:hypothetical protein